MTDKRRAKKLYLLAVGIFLLAFIYSSFFLQGLRLFDNDYNFWIRQARDDSLTKTLSQTFNPILSEWNIQFRPFQVLLFKVLFPFFGYEASGYYYFKSFLLALFSVAYFLFLKRFLENSVVGILSALFLIISSSTFTSLYWVSDMVILSEFLALLVFALFLGLELREKSPRKLTVIATLALMFLLTLLCDRTKANGKLIPAILFFFIVVMDWRKLKRYGILLVLMLIVLVPIKQILAHPIPPFIYDPHRSVEAFSWQPVSWEKFWLLFGQDFEVLSLRYSAYPPASVLAILGFPLVYAAIIGLIIVLSRYFMREKMTGSALHNLFSSRKTPLGHAIVFISLWALINVIALASYPTLPRHFQARYALSVLIPLVPLLLWFIYQALRVIVPAKERIATIIVSVLVGIQLIFHVNHTYRMRNDFATFMIASDASRDYVARNFRNSFFFYFNLPVLSYRPTDDGNQFFSVLRELNLTEEARKRAASLSDCYILSRYPIKNPFLALRKSFPGKSDSLYDKLFNGGERQRYRNTVYLYEVRAAHEAEKR